MTEFRAFCMVAFIISGLMCAADNHDWFGATPIRADTILFAAFFFACAAISIFGKGAKR